MKIASGVCGLVLALIAFPTNASYNTIARVEVIVPAAWVGSSTYCVVSNGQMSQYGWAQAGSSICIAGYFVSAGTYHVTTYHAGNWTQPHPIGEITTLNGAVLTYGPVTSFVLPASNYTVNVHLAD